MSSVSHVNCDAMAATARPEGGSGRPRLVLVVTILASSLAFVDGSVVNVGLPAIARGLGAGAADLQWVINAYLLPLSALLLLGGAAGDRFGQRRVLVIGTTIFGLASAGCALAPNLAWLLLGRAVQGVGAAMLMPNSLAILGASFSGEARGRAIGTWAAAAAAAGAIGPVLGGWLIDQVGWRAIFVLNLPVAGAAIALALVFVRDAAAEAPPAALDTPGALAATLALGALTWGLTLGSGPHGWTWDAIAALVVGAAALVGFVGIEHRRGLRALAGQVGDQGDRRRPVLGGRTASPGLSGADPQRLHLPLHPSRLETAGARRGALRPRLNVGPPRPWALCRGEHNLDFALVASEEHPRAIGVDAAGAPERRQDSVVLTKSVWRAPSPEE